MEKRTRCVATIAMAIMWCSTAWGAEQMAPKGAPAGPMPKGAATPAPGMVMPGVAPKIVISPWNLAADNVWPESDTRVTLTFQIKNHGQGRVENIPWAIHDASINRTLKTGTQGALAPGETVTISTVWQPGSGGPHLLQAYVDPSGTALKNTATQTVVTLNFIVPAPGRHLLRVGLSGWGRGQVMGIGIDCSNTGTAPLGSGFGACHVEVAHGATVSLIARSAAPNRFVGWSNACRSTRQEADGRQLCEVQVNKATAVTAGFAGN
jgi:hypothetical protein